jgi:hypothetical protein
MRESANAGRMTSVPHCMPSMLVAPSLTIARSKTQTKADREGHLQSGIATGVQERLDRLEALVTKRAR